MSTSEKLGLSVTEAAIMLGISRPTMYELVRREGFPVLHVGRRVIIPRQGLEDWMARESATRK